MPAPTALPSSGEGRDICFRFWRELSRAARVAAPTLPPVSSPSSRTSPARSSRSVVDRRVHARTISVR
eukprot:9503473-Pyramimonas_sp.AAC.1